MTVEVRQFEIRSVNDEKREVSGIAVPFDTVVSVGGYNEKFERGSIDAVTGVKLFWNHNEPIGKVTRGEETDEGYEVTAVISATERGNEAYTLLKDGVVDKFSVGFVPVEHRMEDDTVVRTKVNLKEVSLVPFPAYEGASVMSVRSEAETLNNTKEDIIMSKDNEVTSQDVADIRETVTDLERRMAVFANGGSNTNAVVVENRSGGELLKGLLVGDEMAKRAFTGATTADTNVQAAWVDRAVKLATANRQVLNLFSKAPHPGSTSVTMPVLSGVTETNTGVQSAEGNDLEYVEVRMDDVTFNNVTVGNYASLSRQAIELGTPGYLTKVLEFQAQQYAVDTEALVRTALYGATGTATATLAADTFVGWAGLVVDAVSAVAGNGSNATAEFMLVSTDVFKRLATRADSAGRPLLEVNGDGSNTIGSASVTGLRGNILGLPVVVDPKAAANTCVIASSEAITVMESAGAPFRLQDENIINLTKDFSVYGYIIVAPVNKLAIVKVDADLVA